tara:strand:- start:2678 stop:3985 length:1308 start_codon:yes stop_codon:yes gene_type:complete
MNKNKINTLKKKYLSNFSWMIAENIIRIVVGVTISIYVVRFLGPNDYGIYVYALSLTGILAPLATLGIDSILLRDVILNKEKEKVLLHTAAVLKLFAGVSLSLVTITCVYLFSDDEHLLHIIIILMAGISINSLNTYKEYMVSINKMKLIALAGIISIIISSFFRLGLIFSNAGVVWFAFAVFLAQITNVISLRHYYKKISGFQKKYFSKAVAQNLLNDSWPLIFTSFSGLLFVYSDQIFIKYFFEYERVGIYGAAVQLVLYFKVIPSIISNMIYPKIIEINKNNSSDDFENKMLEIYGYKFIISVFFILMFYIFGDLVIKTLYGEKFLESALILKMYSLSFVFMFFDPINNKLLMIDNLQKIMLFRNLIGLTFNLILNYFLIQIFGIIGAVYSTLISQVVITLSYLLDKRIKYIFFIQIKALAYPIRIIQNLYK